MILLYDPGAILAPLDAACAAADRLQPPHMRLRKGDARALVVEKVPLDRVEPIIGRSYLSHDPVGRPRRRLDGDHPHHGAVRQQLDGVAAAKIDIVSTSVHTINEQILPVPHLVRQASPRHTTNQRTPQCPRVRHELQDVPSTP